MKVFLFVFSTCLGFCVYKCCTDKPFVQELPFLLMPDTNSKIALRKIPLTEETPWSDMRSDCIQTDYNFSSFSYWKVPLDSNAKQEISNALSSNTRQLFIHESLFKGTVSFEKNPVVWIEKTIHSVRLMSKSLSTDELAVDFVKTGENFLPCKIDIKNSRNLR